MQGPFREHAGPIQGTCRAHSGNIEVMCTSNFPQVHAKGVFAFAGKELKKAEAGWNIQGILRAHSDNIQVPFRKHSEPIQGNLRFCILSIILKYICAEGVFASAGMDLWPGSGNIQGPFREHSGPIQGTFRALSGNIEVLYMFHFLLGTCVRREHSEPIEGTFRTHSGNIQGPFREHSGPVYVSFTLRYMRAEGVFAFAGKELKKSEADLNREHSGPIQGTYTKNMYREHAGNIYREHAGNIYREHAGNIEVLYT
jgi:hypothetical protein